MGERVRIGELLRARREALGLGIGWLCARLCAERGGTACACGQIVAVEAGHITPTSLELVEWCGVLELPVEALYVAQEGAA